MTWELILAPEAEAEIAEARDWYDSRSPGLGADFLDAVALGLATIKDNPLQYQLVSELLRRVGLGRFPYNLLYTAMGDLIRVVGCVHGARNPQVWQERI